MKPVTKYVLRAIFWSLALGLVALEAQREGAGVTVKSYQLAAFVTSATLLAFYAEGKWRYKL